MKLACPGTLKECFEACPPCRPCSHPSTFRAHVGTRYCTDNPPHIESLNCHNLDGRIRANRFADSRGSPDWTEPLVLRIALRVAKNWNPRLIRANYSHATKIGLFLGIDLREWPLRIIGPSKCHKAWRKARSSWYWVWDDCPNIGSLQACSLIMDVQQARWVGQEVHARIDLC